MSLSIIIDIAPFLCVVDKDPGKILVEGNSTVWLFLFPSKTSFIIFCLFLNKNEKF